MSEITTSDLTEAKTGGVGVFDKLMASASLHIREEFTKSRIKGTDYSKVYLGGMQAVLAQATSFLLQKEQAGLQADLLKEQIALAQQEHEKGVIELELLSKQVLKLSNDIVLTQSQIDLVNAQVINTKAELPKINAEVIIAERTADNLSLTGTQIRATVTKINADTLRVNEDTANAVLTGNVISEQKGKVSTETTLLKQKVITEQAQTSDEVQSLDITTGAFSAKVVNGGTSKKQQDLYTKQKDGFDRDAEQKLAKMMIDHRNVVASITTNPDSNATNLSTASVAAIIKKAKEGVGVEGNLVITELGGEDSDGNFRSFPRNAQTPADG